jgi:hypothetical protein
LDPVTLVPDGDDVIKGCSACGAAETVPNQPTESCSTRSTGFVAAHAARY